MGVIKNVEERSEDIADIYHEEAKPQSVKQNNLLKGYPQKIIPEEVAPALLLLLH